MALVYNLKQIRRKPLLSFGIWVGGKKTKRMVLEFNQKTLTMKLESTTMDIDYCMSYFWKRMLPSGFM